MDSKIAVLAIGGNSLIRDKDHIALSWQYEAVKESAGHIADLIGEGLSIVITHGNGPQVGFIYRRGELARHELPLIPLDICGADTQGAIGYMIQKALLNEFRKRGMVKKVTTGSASIPEGSMFLHHVSEIGRSLALLNWIKRTIRIWSKRPTGKAFKKTKHIVISATWF